MLAATLDEDEIFRTQQPQNRLPVVLAPCRRAVGSHDGRFLTLDRG